MKFSRARVTYPPLSAPGAASSTAGAMLWPGAASSSQRMPLPSSVSGRWLAFIRYCPAGLAGASRLMGIPRVSAMRLKTWTDGPWMPRSIADSTEREMPTLAAGRLVADRPQPFLAELAMPARGAGRGHMAEPLPVPHRLLADAGRGGNLADRVVAVTADITHAPSIAPA